MAEDVRLPAHVEAAALIRRTHAEGGFATVLHRGERDAGTLLVVLRDVGTNPRLYERMPQVDGSRTWQPVTIQGAANEADFSAYLDRRVNQDRDIWIIELDIVRAERLIGLREPSR